MVKKAKSNNFYCNSLKAVFQGICMLIFFLNISHAVQAHEGHKKKIKLFTEKIKKEPLNPENYYLRGVQYQSHGDFEEAKTDLLKVLALEPHHMHVDYNLALLYFEQNLLKIAMTHAQNYIKKSPENYEAYHLKGHILNKNNKYRMAADAYKQAIKKSKNPSIELYYALSENYKDAGNLEKATQSLVKGMEEIGSLIPMQKSIIKLEIAKENWVKAHALIDNIIARVNRKETWYVYKAEVFKLQKKNEEAKKYFIMAHKTIEQLSPNLRRKNSIKNLEVKIASNIN
ncbi:tetratricopeptide repeat protein [Polaribacter sp.]|uniref:tetratricopeptide repeat protein n=1 Tax=Polaribacter sp. TaxID=1920175 RepID=UPI003EF1A0EF